MGSEALKPGDVARIAGVTPKTVYDWKKDLGPSNPALYMERLERWSGARYSIGVGEQPLPETPPPGVDPDAWPAIRELLPRLSDIYTAKELEQHAERWGWITGNIKTFSDIVRADVEAMKRERKKAARAG